MQVFDASSVIYAWDNYPLLQFPGLWEWMAAQIGEGTLVMPIVAFEEVTHKAPDCADWLKGNDLGRLETTNAVMKEALRIKGLLGIIADNYHPKGVDENDLLIIASARVYSAELVSNESPQRRPEVPAKRKIPAVCAMNEISVPCVSFIEYIKRANVIFR